MMRRLGLTALLSGLALVTVEACGSNGSNPFPSGGGGATASGVGGSSVTGNLSGGIGGGLSSSCSPACEAGQFCSTTGVCIANGTCADPGDCGMGLVCDAATKTCIPGSACGAQEESAQAVPPNLLIVLDRSCSMTQKVGAQTKWQIAVAALNGMTTTFKDKIRFGITLFPDKVTPNCAQDKIPFAPAPGNEAAIQDLLTKSLSSKDPMYPAGPCVTNIDTALLQAKAEPVLADPTRTNYVMLVTDGEQSSGCSLGGGDKGSVQAITDMFNAKVKTFVIGFGGGVNVTVMNNFADAGGTTSGDPKNHFYNAADAASLESALQAIAAETLSCTYALDQKVADPSLLYVFFDNDPKGVQKDATHMNGWDYDAMTNSITFYGAACQSLKDSKVKDLDIVYGCAAPTPG